MFRYTPRQIPNKIMVIGCGGTGSRLVPMLVQFIRSITREHSPTGWLESPQIILVDDDVVEHKNLLRQNFIEADVGKNKAAVLAQRYGRHFGIEVAAATKRVELSTTYNELIPAYSPDTDNVMVIIGVDSSDARRKILNMIRNSVRVQDVSRSPFVIDAGNENNYGQVKFFNMALLVGIKDRMKTINFPKMNPIQWDLPAIPYPKEFYDTLEDAPSQGSCADLNQTLAINALMATNIMAVVQNFYYVKTFTHNEVSISLDGAGYTSFNTISNFRERAVRDTPYGYSLGTISGSHFTEYAAAANREVARMEQAAARAKAVEEAKLREAEEAKRKAEEAVREEERREIMRREAKRREDSTEIDEVVEEKEVKKKSPKKKPVVTLEAIPLPVVPELQQVSSRSQATLDPF